MEWKDTSSALVLTDMGATFLSILSNLAVIISLRDSKVVFSYLPNLIILNLSLTNLVQSVLVRSIEVVYIGMGAATNSTSINLEFCSLLTVGGRTCVSVSTWSIVILVWLTFRGKIGDLEEEEDFFKSMNDDRSQENSCSGRQSSMRGRVSSSCAVLSQQQQDGASFSNNRSLSVIYTPANTSVSSPVPLPGDLDFLDSGDSFKTRHKVILGTVWTCSFVAGLSADQMLDDKRSEDCLMTRDLKSTPEIMSILFTLPLPLMITIPGLVLLFRGKHHKREQQAEITAGISSSDVHEVAHSSSQSVDVESSCAVGQRKCSFANKSFSARQAGQIGRGDYLSAKQISSSDVGANSMRSSLDSGSHGGSSNCWPPSNSEFESSPRKSSEDGQHTNQDMKYIKQAFNNDRNCQNQHLRGGNTSELHLERRDSKPIAEDIGKCKPAIDHDEQMNSQTPQISRSWNPVGWLFACCLAKDESDEKLSMKESLFQDELFLPLKLSYCLTVLNVLIITPSLLVELLVDETENVTLLLLLKFGLPSVHSILEPLVILAIRKDLRWKLSKTCGDERLI